MTTVLADGSRDLWLRAAESVARAMPHLEGVDATGGPGLYAGAAGRLVFLSELERVSPGATDPVALQSLVDGLATAPVASGALMSGRLGVALSIANAADVTESPAAVRELAWGIALSSQPKPPEGWDVFGGLLGQSLALVALHQWGGPPPLLDAALDLYRTALDLTDGNPHGLHPPWTPKHRAPLMGMGHGASGLALVSAELALATGRREPFRFVAESAIGYEDRHYDSHARNWSEARALSGAPRDTPWARKGEGGRLPLAHPTAWCSGWPGFVLARLRAWEVFDLRSAVADPSDLVPPRDQQHALDQGDYTYCCGAAGVVEVGLQRYRVSGDRSQLEKAEAVGLECIRKHTRGGGWLRAWQEGGTRSPESLMKGRAGVGLMMLRLHSPMRTLSPILPAVDWRRSPTRPSSDSESSPESSSVRRLRHRLITKYWGRSLTATVESLEKILCNDVPESLERDHERTLAALEARVEGASGEIRSLLDAERSRYLFDKSDLAFATNPLEPAGPRLAAPDGSGIALADHAALHPGAGGEGLLVFHVMRGGRLSEVVGIGRALVDWVHRQHPRVPTIKEVTAAVADSNPQHPRGKVTDLVRTTLAALTNSGVIVVRESSTDPAQR